MSYDHAANPAWPSKLTPSTDVFDHMDALCRAFDARLASGELRVEICRQQVRLAERRLAHRQRLLAEAEREMAHKAAP